VGVARKPKHVPAGFKEGGQFFGPKSVRTLIVRLFKRDKPSSPPQPAAPSRRTALPDSPAARRFAPSRASGTPAPRSLRPGSETARRLTPPGPTAQGGDLEGEARERLRHVERLRGVAETLAELDELTENQATPRALEHRVRSRGALHGLPPELVDQLAEAARTGERGYVDAVIAEVASEHGLTRVTGGAGMVERLNRNKHRMIGSAVWPDRDDAAVIIVRPGYSARVAGGRVTVVHAVVMEASPARTRELAARPPRERSPRAQSLIPPARPRQPRTQKPGKAPRKPAESASPTEVKVTKTRRLAKKLRVTQDPVPRANARVADPRADRRLGSITRVDEDRGTLVVRWDDGRFEALPITVLFPAWRPGAGGGAHFGPPVTADQLGRRVRAAAAERNADEMRLLLSRMPEADLRAFAVKAGLDKRQSRGLSRDALVTQVIASLLSQELERRYSPMLSSPAAQRMKGRG
jgi:hypothetical protein